MKRTPVSLDEIAARDNLVLATWKAARGKRTRPEVQAFLADLDGSLGRLSAGILAGTVPKGAFREFLINDPKLRRIHAACFEDRVLHHAILNSVETVFERSLADSSFACRPGRGSHAAVRRVQACVRRYPWFGQVDVAAYFPSIRHDVLKALLARRFKGAGFLALLGRIIDAYAASPGCGLPIGALTSQHFANFYLDGADRRLLANSAVRACVRYMDDIVWWGDSRAAVRAVRDDLTAWLATERGLALKPDVRVQRSGLGITFCGYRILPGTLRLTRRKQRRYRALRAGWEAAWAGGQIDALRLQQGYAAVLAPTLPADAAAWRREDLRRHPCLYDDGCG